MADEVKKGNFDFVREINADIFKRVSEAESLGRLDYKTAGLRLREAFEVFLDILINEYQVKVESKSEKKDVKPSSSEKQKALYREKRLPFLKGDWYYLAVDGGDIKRNPYDIWRLYGNQCAHPEQRPDDPAICYENIIVILEIAHDALWEIYKRKRNGRTTYKRTDFNPNVMPIGDNYVIKYHKPFDKDVTHCVMEFETCSYKDTGRVDKYSIIRVYDKSDIDESGMDVKLVERRVRDVEAFGEAASEAGIQFAGNVVVDVLSKMNSEYSPFYIVAYKFSSKPHPLEKEYLAGISIQDREGICRQITETILKLHSLSTPIYHRNITYDCVYICERTKGKPEASIIKFDCAKIDSGEFGTVIQSVKDKQSMAQTQMMMKYYAPEARAYLQGASKSISWEKADVYSLGILLADILNGDISFKPVPAMKLETLGVNVDFVQAIERMRNPNPDARPSLENIISIIGQ